MRVWWVFMHFGVVKLPPKDKTYSEIVSPSKLFILLMAEILHQLIGRLSHYLQGFIHHRWCRISSINSSKQQPSIDTACLERCGLFRYPSSGFSRSGRIEEKEELWQPELIDPESGGSEICHVVTILMYPFWWCSSIYHLLYQRCFLLKKKARSKILDWAFSFGMKLRSLSPGFRPIFSHAAQRAVPKKKTDGSQSGVDRIGHGTLWACDSISDGILPIGYL